MTSRPAAYEGRDVLTVYIEGDGFAWLSSAQPSADPTPGDPVALRLALAQPGGQAAYLGRPCQYVDAQGSGCTPAFWTNRRYSEEVVVATNEALDKLKGAAGAKQLVLVGYSGGAAIAALVATRRSDVARLVTIAGNISPFTWAQHHRLAPLTGSLDVSNLRQRLTLPQWHFSGGQDQVVPTKLTESFIATLPAQTPVHLRVVPNFNHTCCWVQTWPDMWRSIHP